MAAVALAHLSWSAASSYLCIFLAGYLFRNHVEVHHVVAGRSLVALRAVCGSRRRMLKRCDCPFSQTVALGAVSAEQRQVPVLGGMASNAIERHPRGALVKLTGNSNAQPRTQRFERRGAGVVCSRRAGECPCADPGEFHMVHRDRAEAGIQMLDVTCPTFADARVERGRLTTGKSFVVRMAARAFRVRHAHVRLVAGLASIGEISVPGR